jgi:hypothetical protein
MTNKVYRVKLRGTAQTQIFNLNLDYQLSPNAKLYVEFFKLVNSNLNGYFNTHPCISVRIPELSNSNNYDISGDTSVNYGNIILRLSSLGPYHDVTISENAGFLINNNSFLKNSITVKITDEAGATVGAFGQGDVYILDLLIVD